MATSKSKSTEEQAAEAPSTDSSEDAPGGAIDPNVTASADTQAAEQAGMSEGEFKALRDDAGLNQSAGHEANVHAWESSAQGQAWLEDEKDREKAAEEEAKKYEEQFEGDSNVDKAAQEYYEAVEQGKGGSPSSPQNS